MNPHALSVLEFPRLLDVVAGPGVLRGRGEPSADVRADDRPGVDSGGADPRGRNAGAGRGRSAVDAISDPGGTCSTGSPSGDWRDTRGAGFSRAGGTLLTSSRLTQEALRDARRPVAATAVLASHVGHLVSLRDVEAAIGRTIDQNGDVLDSASPRLRSIRRSLRGAQGELVALLERLMAGLESHQQVPDMSVTVRNGRYVIPVRREARVVVGGIVHDASGTGATVFVEPPAAIEAGNRIRELESDEIIEVERILWELTEQLRPHHAGLYSAFESLIELDALYARARFAVDCHAQPVELCDPGDGFVINAGRHPLLLAQGVRVIPFDLTMLPDERTLLISGPNTGGKTVLLKAVALLSLLTQCGIPVPVAMGSRIAVFDDVFADVGDEQSIEASLSTFSAHVKNLAEILNKADARTLVLIDELGSGTDPVEGAALGGAVLEALTARGTLTVATTHLGTLKELAIENAGVVNASLQFDPVALAPTYRLIKGIPGRSYGISIARRLLLPEDVLVRAEQRLPTGERDANALLANLEARETALEDREREGRSHLRRREGARAPSGGAGAQCGVARARCGAASTAGSTQVSTRGAA